MPFEKGKSGNISGRPVGSKNKIDTRLKVVINGILKKKSNDLEKWLDQTAEKDPAKAANIFLKLCEFAIPKLKPEAEVNKTEPQDKVFKITYSDLNDD